MEKTTRALLILFPTIVASVILGVTDHFRSLAIILVLSLITVVGFAMDWPFAPAGSALAYLLSVFESASLSSVSDPGFVNQFAALLLAPVGIADGLLLHSNANKPRLRKLGIGLFVFGAVLDIISLV